MKKIFIIISLLTSMQCFAQVDSSPVLQNLIDTNCAAQDSVKLPQGKSFLYSPLILRTNCKIFGEGANFGNVLVPIGVSAFVIDGANVSGGWAFRNVLTGFSIDGSQAGTEPIIKINKSYNISIDDVFIYDHIAPTGIDVLVSNAVIINKLVMRGTPGGSQIGISIRDKASVFISQSDIEVHSRCIKTSGESVTDLFSSYMERCIVDIEHTVTGMGSMNVYGGKLKSINGYNILLKGNNFNVYGTKLESYNASVLDGRVIHCWLSAYDNISLNGITPYPGYYSNTNCEGKGVID